MYSALLWATHLQCATVLRATHTFIYMWNEAHLTLLSVTARALSHLGYSFPISLRVGGWVGLGSCLHNARWFACLKMITHPSINRATVINGLFQVNFAGSGGSPCVLLLRLFWKRTSEHQWNWDFTGEIVLSCIWYNAYGYWRLRAGIRTAISLLLGISVGGRIDEDMTSV